MRQLNEGATRIFARLLHKLGPQNYAKLKSEGFMPLTIERLDEGIVTDAGAGQQVSLCHYYEQNGDLCRDPEMCFLVVDNRQQPKDHENLHIYPYYYRQDNLGLEESSVTFSGNAIENCLKKWQYAHTQFANSWLQNIRNQGFLR